MDERAESQGEAIPEDLPRHNDWRSWYRRKALDRLMTRGYLNEGVDKCIQDLEKDASPREAAVALFWSVYLDDKEPLCLEEGQIERITAILAREIRDAGEEKQHQAFVKLHLAGTLAVSLIRPEIELNPDAVSKLEEAARIGSSFPDMLANDGKHGLELFRGNLFCFSSLVIWGIAQVELAWRCFEEDRFEEALILMSRGAPALETAAFEVPPQPRQPPRQSDDHMSDKFENVLDRREPYQMTLLPHSGKDYDPQEAVWIFEDLKKNSGMVKHWEGVRTACERMEGLNLYMCEDTVEDSDGDLYPFHSNYWMKAVRFAESQKPTEKRALESLQGDLLRDVWDDLPAKVRTNLEVAETAWLRAAKERPDSEQYRSQIRSMLEDYHSALARLLAYVCPLLKTELETDKRSKDNKESKLSFMPLTRMKERLEDESKASRGLCVITGHLPREDGNYVLSLVDFLKDMIGARSDFVHPPEEHTEVTAEKRNEDAKAVRYKLLGIEGKESVIKRLVKIKRAMAHIGRGDEHRR